MSVKFEQVLSWHIYYVANRMRQCDIDEVFASSGLDPKIALINAIALSDSCTTFMVDNEPIAICGLVTKGTIQGSGSPWLLGTDGVERFQIAFMRAMRTMVKQWLEQSPVLINMIHAKNVKSIEFLKSLGFAIGDPVPFGYSQELFHPFSMARV